MAFYDSFKTLGNNLLTKFGTTCTLYHKEGDKVVEYKGLGAKFKYTSEAIGMSNNIIKAGDARIVCQFDVSPTETTDIVKMGNDLFNIISVGETSPDNSTKILYSLQVRRKN